MIGITDHADGCLLAVYAQPGARKPGIVGEHGGMLKVAVAAPPEDDRANKALVEVLRAALKLKRSQVELVSGETRREKRLLIRGLARGELAARVATLLGQ